jgi:predicted nucleotide-binding protein (sugar kinase/HSP70/actin superfamily)
MKLKEKTIYVPYMCDHVLVLTAVLRAFGLSAQVLPPPDDETLDLGLSVVLGKECSPVSPRPATSCAARDSPALILPIRYLYARGSRPMSFWAVPDLQRQILDEHGLHEVEIVTLSTENSYGGIGENPTRMRAKAWEAVVVTDLLQKLLHAYRPYELQTGQTDALYHVCLQRLVEATEAGGGRRLQDAVKWIARQFEALPVDRSELRPLIGLVGEIYLRVNEYANQDIIRQVEAVGGEVVLATLQEWIYFVNWHHVRRMRDEGDVFDILETVLTDLYQRDQEHKLVRPAAHLLRTPYEASSAHLMDNIRSYYEPLLATETVMTIGESIELARHGVSGILNIMPFSCMPGIISSGVGPTHPVRSRQYSLVGRRVRRPWWHQSPYAPGGVHVPGRALSPPWSCIALCRERGLAVQRSGLGRSSEERRREMRIKSLKVDLRAMDGDAGLAACSVCGRQDETLIAYPTHTFLASWS